MIVSSPRAGSAPCVTVPLSYLVAAAAAFITAALGVVWLAPELAGHYYHPRVVALTHTVTLGWITLTIMGASFQLIPIVLERPIWISMARHRKRPQLDWGLGFVLTGTVFLLPVTVLGLGFALDLISGPHLGLSYAVLALGGWVSLTIAGMMLKIVPFLVWYRSYGPRAGKAPVPTLGQLSWRTGERSAYLLLTLGMVLLPAAVAAGEAEWIRAAGAILSLGALVFGVTIAHILHHLVRAVTPESAAPAQAPAR